MSNDRPVSFEAPSAQGLSMEKGGSILNDGLLIIQTSKFDRRVLTLDENGDQGKVDNIFFHEIVDETLLLLGLIKSGIWHHT